MKKSIAVMLLVASGVAWACTMKPMPPLIVPVSVWDIALAAFQGHANPSRAAAMANLDEAATSLLGASEWRANNYMGNVTYQFASGNALVTEDKPCDKDAVDSLPVPTGQSGATGGSGGSGGFRWYGGRIYGGGGCIYNCGGTVTVGELEQP